MNYDFNTELNCLSFYFSKIKHQILPTISRVCFEMNDCSAGQLPKKDKKYQICFDYPLIQILFLRVKLLFFKKLRILNKRQYYFKVRTKSHRRKSATISTPHNLSVSLKSELSFISLLK